MIIFFFYEKNKNKNKKIREVAGKFRWVKINAKISGVALYASINTI